MYTQETVRSRILGIDSLEDINTQEMDWCLTRWHTMMGVTLAGEFEDDIFQSNYYGEVMVALEKRIRELGGRVVPMESVSAA